MKRMLVLLVVATSFSAFSQSKLVAIKCGELIDGRSDTPTGNAIVIIEGYRIKDVGTNLNIPEGAEVIDLSQSTVLPGLIDCHTHLLVHGDSYDNQLLKEPLPYRAIPGAVAARRTLEAGFTTVRDVGAMYGDVSLREAINNGVIPGPRIFPSTRSLSMTRGSRRAGGVDGVTKAVRERIQFGADWIKIYADSRTRHRIADSLVGSATFTDDEVKAIVYEAEKVGIHVCAHCYTSEAAQRALRGGVRSIEHGLYLNDETFRLMKQKEAYWVPTLIAFVRWANDSTNSPEVRNMVGYSAKRHKETFARGLISGVKIAFGSDFHDPHGGGAREFSLMVEYGMSPMKAIQAATSVASHLLGYEERIGTIEQGKLADIIAVNENPLENLRTLEHVRFVMKGGVVHKNDVR